MCSSSLLRKEIWKAADLRVAPKSHNKVVIQSKHLCCADSNAAVDGCKLIMNFDSSMLELMMHLFKPFTCFCWAVKRRREALQFSWVNWEAPLKMSSDRCFPPGQQRPGNGYSHFPKLKIHRETEETLREMFFTQQLTHILCLYSSVWSKQGMCAACSVFYKGPSNHRIGYE